MNKWVWSPREVQIAWAAGLFEGEGSICFQGERSINLQLTSTDQDVARKFHEVLGRGKLTGPWKNGVHKPFWKVQVCGNNAAEVLKEMLPHLCSRRSAKALEALERRKVYDPRPCTECAELYKPSGHGGIDQKYCSAPCRQRGNNKRRQLKKVAA